METRLVMKRLLDLTLVLLMICIGCGKEQVANQQSEKTVDAASEPQEKPILRRTLRAKELTVLASLTASVPGRQQFDFAFFDKGENGRIYIDDKNKIMVFFNGHADDLESVSIAMSTKDLLDEVKFGDHIKTFLNAANRMVASVFPSIATESDSWLDNHLVGIYMATESKSFSSAGYKMVLSKTSDSKIVMYSIVPAE
jgi:hypothetical protein